MDREVVRNRKLLSSTITVPLWAALLPIVVALAVLLVLIQRGDSRLHIWVFDVGEGDAILVRTPSGHTVLVDGGPGATPLFESIGNHLPFWQHNLDVVVLTQPQQENMMGLVNLLDKYKIDQIVQTDFTPTTSLQQVWMASLSSHNIPIHHARRGDTISFQDDPEVAIRVLNPGEGDILKGDKNTLSNDTSIVLKIEYGSTRIMLAGDIGKGAEANILRQSGSDLHCQVLKVAQHGSANSSSQAFLEAVRPQVSIVSVGSNTFGYPASETLDMLHDVGSQVYRTDQDGTVEIIAERDRFWVQSEK